jgi:hypothetical protein
VSISRKNDLKEMVNAKAGRTEREGVADSQIKVFIASTLEDIPPEVMRLLPKATYKRMR